MRMRFLLQLYIVACMLYFMFGFDRKIKMMMVIKLNRKAWIQFLLIVLANLVMLVATIVAAFMAGVLT